MDDNPYRVLPSIAELASTFDAPPIRGAALTSFLQGHTDSIRAEIRAGSRPTRDEVLARIDRALSQLSTPRLRPVINATGVLLHTNLGRAPVSRATADAMHRTASGYVGLEIQPETGARGGRMSEVSSLMRLLTGAEATLVVNNNAAAVLLTLAALAAGKSVIVSRGEAVEIGGGFRIPDVMRQSGARLVEVGTTNRTYPGDYEAAVHSETAIFLKVHASNFAIAGFTATTSIAELAPISRKTGVPIVEDLGSGCLLDTTRFGLAAEPTIAKSIAAGAAIVTASGDKLLGGPQAGIVAGRSELVARIERHPLARAVRADKTCLAGIAETLRHYARDEAITEIPIWTMIATPIADLFSRAVSLQDRLVAEGIDVDVRATTSTIGGGALPGQTLPSAAVVIARPDLDELAAALRMGEPGVYGRISDGALFLDLRTVPAEYDAALGNAVAAAISRVDGRQVSSSFVSRGNTD